ncbi:MAG TPA: TerB family tellurite resistance protein [Candidatus Eisenbacteria bacterium]|nr:TerB family tellurite resistance protein [Candidatus Eisenbacteria bacterium]
MALRRFLAGVADPGAADTDASPGDGDARDTATVRRIVRELEALPPERARFLASFAYVLTRAASADLEIANVEMAAIERLIAEYGGLPPAQAVLVAEMARTQSLLYGGTEDYLVTRQFRALSTPEERVALLRCCYLVGAADDTITASESDTLQTIARELDLDRPTVNAIRNEFASKLSAIQALLRFRGDAPG